MNRRRVIHTTKTFRSSGFTLVEVLCALALTGLLSAALFSLYQRHQEIYSLNRRIMEDQSRLRAVMGIITRHLRSAGYDPTERAGAGIVSARPDFVYLTRDIAADAPGHHPDGGDGRLTSSGEHIAFCRYGSNTLGMHSGRSGGGRCSGSGAPAPACPGMGFHQPLADDISELSFRYFSRDADGSFFELFPEAASGEIADLSRIERIDVTLAATFSLRGREQQRTLTESVFLRNMNP